VIHLPPFAGAYLLVRSVLVQFYFPKCQLVMGTGAGYHCHSYSTSPWRLFALLTRSHLKGKPCNPPPALLMSTTSRSSGWRPACRTCGDRSTVWLIAMVAHLRDLHTYLHDCGEMARRRGSAGDCAAPEVSCLYSPPRPKSGIQPRQRSSRLSEGPPLKNLQAPMTAGALGQSEDMPQTGWRSVRCWRMNSTPLRAAQRAEPECSFFVLKTAQSTTGIGTAFAFFVSTALKDRSIFLST